MRRLLVSLLLAHVIASYGVLLAVTFRHGNQGADVLVITPLWAPGAVLDVTANALKPEMPWQTLAMVDGTYALCFAATLALRGWEGRRHLRKARRRSGVCAECGYDLTGNVSGKCPECGAHVNPKAKLLLRRGG